MTTTPTPPVCSYEGSDYQTSFWEKGGRAYEDGCEAVALKRLLRNGGKKLPHSVRKNQPPSGGHLLELGAGAGRNTPRYGGYEKVTLLDYSTTQLAQARARLGDSDHYRYIAADIYRLPFVDGLFDGATMIRTLHHMLDAPRALAQVRRVLQPQSTFILEYANKRNIKSILRWMLGRQEWSPFTREQVEYLPLNFDFHPAAIRQWMSAAGFNILRTLTVSHLRLGLLKRLVPTRLLVALDSLFSLTGGLWQLTPSVFLKAEADSKGKVAAEDDFFICPNCSAPLADTPPLLRCASCAREYPVIDGIYDLRVDPPRLGGLSMPDSLLDDLNPQQHQAVTAGDGAILVLAGPGSGKTRVLTRRLAYLVERRGIPAYDIIAVTFTNKAAREMENRVVTMVQCSLEGIWLGTFHAMCARLLRREANYLPYKSNFVIFDSDDQESLVKRALRELRIDEKTHRPAGIHAAISSAKNDLLLPADMPIRTYRDEVVKRVYTRYQEMLQTNNAVDFDDLLMLSAHLLRDNPGVAEKYARRFQHVLVDEFQDTNLAQYALLTQLCAFHHNLFVVGDEDQSIYRWRGADYRNVRRFETDFPKFEKVLLEQNYRSTQTILDAARQVIDRNHDRTPKHLFTNKGTGNKLVMFTAVDDLAESAFAVDTIQQYLLSRKGVASDFAVMYRTNAQSRIIEEAFIHARIPYRLVGALKFYGRREIKDLIAFMRLVENPADEVSLLRMVSVPPRGIGEKTVLSLQAAALHAGISAGDVLLDLGQKGAESSYWTLIGRSAALLADFGAMLADWGALKNSISLVSLFDRIIQDTGYEPYINDQSDEGNDRWENVQELRRLAYDFQEKGLTEFLQNLALVSDQDTIPAGEEAQQGERPQGAVTLLTLHAAKGLEFNQVFILGLDEGLLPHSRSRDDPEEMAEERRLFYVGMTRARNQLYLLRSERRSSFGNWDYSEASRFLQDISDDLLLNQGKRSSSRRDAWQDDMRWTKTGVSTPRRAAPPPSVAEREAHYKAGMRVRSPNFGEGVVLECKVDPDGEETVDVHFESVGFKRLLASLAKLEIII